MTGDILHAAFPEKGKDNYGLSRKKTDSRSGPDASLRTIADQLRIEASARLEPAIGNPRFSRADADPGTVHSEADRRETETGGLREPGRIRGDARVLDESPGSDHRRASAKPIEGLPREVTVDGKSVTFGPHVEARQIVQDYARKAGLEYRPPTAYVKGDPTSAERVS